MTKQERDAEGKRARYAADPATKERDAQRRRQRQHERYVNDPIWRAQRIQAAVARKRFHSRGLTETSYLLVLESQGRKCAGCLKDVDERTGYVDHDHSTGKARGVLCHHCNMSVHKHASPEQLRRLADYLERA